MHDIKSLFAAALVAGTIALGATFASAGERFIVLASTTSTDNSGLFKHILPMFTAITGIEVRVIARGTGQALQIGRDGDADVLLVHDTTAELAFVDEGYGVKRRRVMYNDFIIVGPRDDAAGIAGGHDVVASLKQIAQAGATFVSRGDDSGTNRAERRFWGSAGVDVTAASGTWYLEAGAGMGATLNIASAENAHTMSDRGTWLSFENRRDLKILVEGDPLLFNQYGVILIDPVRHPHVKEADGMALIEWLTSPIGQDAIASFRIEGEQLFFPNYNDR
jgi:tungstate transport system substrate-binding protein